MAAARSFSSQHGSSRGRGFFGIRWFHIPLSVGVGVLAYVHIRRKLRDQRGKQERKYGPVPWQVSLVKHLPTRGLSRAMSKVNHAELPQWLLVPVLRMYVRTFGCNMQEAEVEDIRHYRTLGELFLRKLKSSSRSIHEEHPLVSPCDGRVLHCGEVIDGCLEQIKGIDFSLEGFLGADVVQRMSLSKQKDIKGTKLCFITLYLSPGDYHHFHSPASWTVTLRRHFPGQMLPVAQWAVRLFPGLFTVNERVALVGDWKFGSFTFSAVGAFNVGSISLAGDKELCTNVKGEPLNIGEFRDKNLTKGDCDGKVIKKGDYVGTFNLGSTIVLIFDAPKEFLFTVQPNEKVKFGQSIGYVTTDVKPL